MNRLQMDLKKPFQHGTYQTQHVSQIMQRIKKNPIEILGWERSGCYGHRINLIVKHALEVPEVHNILSKCRKLVGHFHKSTSLKDCLIEKQASVFFSDNEKLIGHKLIVDCTTRWNSSLDMLKRVLEQTPAIMAVANE